MGELEWSEHALEELPFGVTPDEIERALRESYFTFRRGREKGEYEVICSIHGRFLFLILIKREQGYRVKTIRDATEKEKRLFYSSIP